MSNIQNLSDEDLRVLKQKFVEEATARELSETLGSEVSRDTVALSDLHNYAHEGKEHIDAKRIEKALASYPAMRNSFRRMVAEAVFYRSGEALAAGEAGPIPRSGNGFSIRYQNSQTISDHVYIIIELVGEVPELRHILYIFDETDTYKSYSLSPPRNGIIQILVPNDEPLLKMLSDPKTEVMLG